MYAQHQTLPASSVHPVPSASRRPRPGSGLGGLRPVPVPESEPESESESESRPVSESALLPTLVFVPSPAQVSVPVAAERIERWGVRAPRSPPLPPASAHEARGLLEALSDLLSRERVAAAEFLVALSEFDRRRGWAPLGYSGLFPFLRRELHLSKGAAFYRATAAELVARFPEVLEALRDGRLCLTSVASVARVVDEENLADRLPRFFGLSSREAKALAAELEPSPTPAFRTLVTTLPVLGPSWSQALPPPPSASPAPTATAPVPSPLGVVQSLEPRPAEAGAPGGGAPAALALELEVGQGHGSGDAQGRDLLAVRLPGQAGPPAARPPGQLIDPAPGLPSGTPAGSARHGFVGPLPADEAEPLTGELRRLHVTVSRQFLEKLGAARDALSHRLPGASVEQVLGAALDALLEKRDRRRGLVKHPRSLLKTPGNAAGSRAGERSGDKPAPPSASDSPLTGSDSSLNGLEARPTGAEPALSGMARGSSGSAPPPLEEAPRLNTPNAGSVPAPGEPLNRSSRYIPAAVRREVWRRDGARCQHPLDGGGLCGSTHRLELDHLLPLALGGRSTVENLRVTCQFHNQAAAEAWLGSARMAQARARRRTATPSRRPGRGRT